MILVLLHIFKAEFATKEQKIMRRKRPQPVCDRYTSVNWNITMLHQSKEQKKKVL
jgi:hypothetical protein